MTRLSDGDSDGDIGDTPKGGVSPMSPCRQLKLQKMSPDVANVANLKKTLCHKHFWKPVATKPNCRRCRSLIRTSVLLTTIETKKAALPPASQGPDRLPAPDEIHAHAQTNSSRHKCFATPRSAISPSAEHVLRPKCSSQRSLPGSCNQQDLVGDEEDYAAKLPYFIEMRPAPES